MSGKEDSIEVTPIIGLEDPSVTENHLDGLLIPNGDEIPEHKPIKKYKYPPAECPICHKMFNNKYTLKTHKQRHEDDSRPIKSHPRIQNDYIPFPTTQKALEVVNNLLEEIDTIRKTFQSLDPIPAATEVTL